MNYAEDELTDVTYTLPRLTPERAGELLHEGRIWKGECSVEPTDFDRQPLQWHELRQLIAVFLRHGVKHGD